LLPHGGVFFHYTPSEPQYNRPKMISLAQFVDSGSRWCYTVPVGSYAAKGEFA